MTLIYLDTETTGLDPERHEVWELAYAVNNGPILSGVVRHSLRYADSKALEVGGYDPRGVVATYSDVEDLCRRALEGATIVGANPAFDTSFLRARWGITPWAYRLLDIEAYAMPALYLDRPRGLAFIAQWLGARGYDIPEPDHTAAGDVATVRACHQALQVIYGGNR